MDSDFLMTIGGIDDVPSSKDGFSFVSKGLLVINLI
jgi:hypothetical protein